MSVATFLEIFGGIGAVILGVGGCILKCYKRYEFKGNYLTDDVEVPVIVLDETCENRYEEQLNPHFGKNCEYVKQIHGKWVINIGKNKGDVFIYRSIDKVPSFEYNKGRHFLRISIKNAPKINCNDLQFQHKYFDANWKQVKRTETESIKHDGENCFESKSLLKNEDGVFREQLGIFISSKNAEIKDLLIDEIYYGDRWETLFNIYCCKKKYKTILYRKIQQPEK
tara:strand:+ start:2606 stop:3280 length:675 start_codon:yes stop_codon:yes gene_type:complete